MIHIVCNLQLAPYVKSDLLTRGAKIKQTIMIGPKTTNFVSLIRCSDLSIQTRERTHLTGQSIVYRTIFQILSNGLKC